MVEKKKCDILVIVQSCAKNKVKRDACSRTWLKHIPKGVEYFFVVGDPKQKAAAKKVKNVVTCKCDDSYGGLCSKTIAMFQYAVGHYDFKYLFKCDDDTYVVLDRLVKLLKDYRGNVFLSNVMWTGEDNTISGGAGYVLSKLYVDIVLEEYKNAPAEKVKGAEDNMVQYSLQRRDVLPTNITLFYRVTWLRVPGKYNDVITAHRFQGNEMDVVEEALYSPDAKHVMCIHYDNFRYAPFPYITFLPRTHMYLWADDATNVGTYRYDAEEKKLYLVTNEKKVETVLDYIGEGFWEEKDFGPLALVSPITPEELEGKELQTAEERDTVML